MYTVYTVVVLFCVSVFYVLGGGGCVCVFWCAWEGGAATKEEISRGASKENKHNTTYISICTCICFIVVLVRVMF